MAKRDYYEILGVPRDAEPDRVKKAYRKLAMQYHPDRNQDDPNAVEKFKEVGEAYAVLSDANKKAQYDRFGHSGMQGAGGAGGFGGSDFGGENFDPFDLFRTIFDGFGFDVFGGAGGGGQRSRQQRGTDLQIDISLSLEEITKGTAKKVKIRYLNRCDECSGTGSKDGRKDVCPHCRGTGRTKQVIFGHMVNITACNHCGGTGRIVSNPCTACGGKGAVQSEKTMNIHVPAGVTEGHYQRLQGAGNVGLHGAPPGDIIVAFHEKSHKLFTRHQDDIIVEREISYPEAVLGADIEIPTLDGKALLKIPAGTPQGKVFRMRGKGITHLNNVGRGDQLVRITVFIPKRIGSKERELLDQLAQHESIKQLESPSFFHKIKNIFTG
ncbi:MAG: molecular chaperone DnaJ [Candidatus Electryoneaceae bacterium]|nr:molecular chaperone DnaJ [Candidatus Electryoneaceae bacterium]